MNRSSYPFRRLGECKPHACGDEPQDPGEPAAAHAVNPTHVGMNR